MSSSGSHPEVVSQDAMREFLDYSESRSAACAGMTRSTSLGIAFGIAGTVLFGALGAAIKYISDKVEEQRKCDVNSG
jgi:hypothetical protein